MLFKICTKTNELSFEAICPNTKTPFLSLSSIGVLCDKEHNANHKFHAYKCQRKTLTCNHVKMEID
jgi:hypothetical protein